MDDQAEKLRQLVRNVRHAATVATGPPLLLIHIASEGQAGTEFVQSLELAAEAMGIALSLEGTDSPESAVSHEGAKRAAIPSADWHLAVVGGHYRIADHELWQRATTLVVVTQADDESIVNCYQSLKTAAQHSPLPSLELAVLSGDDLSQAELAAERLTQTCKRFLPCSIAGACVVPASDNARLLAFEPLVQRLAVMAPVASLHNESHSPLAVHSD